MKYFILTLILLVFVSCEARIPNSSKGLSVITYNLYNMFDDIDNGNEHTAYHPSSGYTGRDFDKRIESYCALFKKEEFDVDIIFFQEIESERVLVSLLDKGMRRRGFHYYGIAKINNIPNTVGFISKIKPYEVKIHLAASDRPILSLEVIKDGEQYKIFNLHAKSNLGEEEENKKERKALARHINNLINPDEKVIILGDFNSSVSDDMLSLNQEEDSIFVSLDSKNIAYGSFYDATEDVYFPLNGDGTYFYMGKWYYYDKILISSSIASNSNFSFKILNLDFLSKDGFPLRYDNSSECGYSDHFALRLDLK